MASAELGFDPIRMTELDTKATAAIAALRAITSTDPSASGAVSAINSLRSTLENGWMPAIQAVRGSTALTGGVAAQALVGADDGDRDVGWFRIPRFQVYDPIAILFPDGDDVTAEEIASKIDEILSMRPSPEQFIMLGHLGRALAEIAEDDELAAEVLAELGPDGLQNVYTELFMLGLEYPYAIDDDHSRMIGTDLERTIGTSFNLVVAAGTEHAVGRRAVAGAIQELADSANAWEAAGLGGLVRVEGLPPGLSRQLFEVVTNLDEDVFVSGWGMQRDNTMYPELEWDDADLRLYVIANNPILIHDLIHDHHSFVEGGEELLRDLVESKGHYWRTEQDIGELLGKIFAHVIGFTPVDELIERRADGGPGTTGVLFDLVDIVLEQDLKVPGHHVLAAIGPFLPEIMGSVPGSASPYTPHEVRSILKDLFGDLSPAQTTEALETIVQSAIAKVPLTITSADFDGTEPAGLAVGDLLDSMFGPVVGALDDVVEDADQQAVFWRAALNDAFGLIPLPASSIAKWAIKRGVREIINGVVTGRESPQTEVAAAQQALIENTVIALYGDAAINAEVVEQALGDWPRTAVLLGGDEKDGRGGHELSIDEVEAIRRALVDARDAGTLLPADEFVRLPQVVDLVESLEDELTLSPERVRGI